MRVLHFFKTYLPDTNGGIERVIWEIAEGTAAHGVEVDVLALSRSPASEPVTLGHHRVHQAKQDLYVASTGISISAVGRFRRLAADADIIHYHFPWPFMDAVHLVTRPARPSVVTYHSDIVRQKHLMGFYAPLMRRFLNAADAIVATSPNYAASSPVLQDYASKVRIIPIGIDEAQLERPTPEQRGSVLQRVPERYFLFIGALRYYKGLEFLIAAARNTGFPVVVAGIGEMNEALRAARLPNLTLLGSVSEAEKLALLEGAAAFVFPSHLRSEAFGVALLEAAMMGRAMISCELGTGTSYVNVDGETGLVVAPGDAEALGRAMRQIWSDPSARLRMGQKARERFENLFTADKMAQSYLSLYQGLLEPRTRP